MASSTALDTNVVPPASTSQTSPDTAPVNHLRCSDKWWTVVKVAALVVTVAAIAHAYFAALPYYAAGFAFLGLVALLGYRSSNQPDPKLTKQITDLTKANGDLTTAKNTALATNGVLGTQLSQLQKDLDAEKGKITQLGTENTEYVTKNSELAAKLKEALNPEKMKAHQAAEITVYQTWMKELKDKLQQLEVALAKAQEPVKPEQTPTS